MNKIKTLKEFYEIIEEDTPTIVYFYTKWCPDCFLVRPFLPKIVKEHPMYRFVKMDRDTDIELAKHLNIFGIPSFVAFKSGDEIGRYVDKKRKSYSDITAFINGLA